MLGSNALISFAFLAAGAQGGMVDGGGWETHGGGTPQIEKGSLVFIATYCSAQPISSYQVFPRLPIA